MGAHGFIKVRRKKERERPVAERVQDFREIAIAPSQIDLREQAARCIDCGIPFCHRKCPLGNLIPEWNQLVTSGELDEAMARLEQTNNFPEVTSRVCPAPCEAACVLEIERDGVAIKLVERGLSDRIEERGFRPHRLAPPTGHRVAVVGSGPGGLAAAQELARMGHETHVFEKDDRLGGLLRYGIPDFKLEKGLLDRRLAQLAAEGVAFRTSTVPSAKELRAFDAVVLAIGARKAHELPIPGRHLRGVRLAMDFLERQNRIVAGDAVSEDSLDARGKRVVVIGSGDTGSDCIGTAIRQGAASVVQLAYKPAPGVERSPDNPWPEWPLVYRTSSSQEEGAERQFSIVTRAFRGTNTVEAIEAVRVDDGVPLEIPCDLALLALGYGKQKDAVLELCGEPNVFLAGDAERGASLVVWAIADGRRAAERADGYLRKTP
jgi:glutamate synthase (NADPH/NADH) small chain